MKLALMAIGGFLVVFGLVDLVGSFAGFDLWGTIGIYLPEIIWKFSAYIEIAAGYALFKLGVASDNTEPTEESAG
jgi:hypothetical protein